MLYEAALQLFETEGFEATSVQRIIEQVGVAKGTFFNHFPSKEHVVSQWYNNITERAMASARAAKTQSAEQAICDLFSDMAQQATSSPELLIAKASNSSNPLLVQAERAQVREISAFLFEQCAAAKASGEVAADLDQEFFVGLLGAVLTGTSRSWVLSQPRINFPALIAQRVRFLFRAARGSGSNGAAMTTAHGK